MLLLDRRFLDAVIDPIWEVWSAKFLRSIVAKVSLKIALWMKTVLLVVEPEIAAIRKQDVVSLRSQRLRRGVMNY